MKTLPENAINWTKPQQKAIEDQGGALLVSAAAGSGKTAVLVERAFAMITRENSPISAERLLILTFTNAAAEELRSRIARRLESALQQKPENAALRRQRLFLRRAFIGTIDAFCQQFVREHFTALELPPDIAVGDNALLQSLSADVLADVMEEMYADEDFAAFAAVSGQSRSDKTAEESILNLYQHSMTLPFPPKQLVRFVQMYQKMPLQKTPWAKQLLAHATAALKEAQQLAFANLALVEDVPELAAYMPTLQTDLSGLAPLIQNAENANWEGLVSALSAHSFARIAPCRAQEELRQIVQAKRDALKKIIADLLENCCNCTQENYEKDFELSAPMVRAICAGTQLYISRYYSAKLSEKVLDFVDFEHLALSLLQDEKGRPTPLAQQVKQRFDAVMIDEYQDTNELQDALYKSLAKENAENLFFVGDAKQSIYRFRQANPGIFMEKKRLYAKTPKGQHPAKIDLGHNFRSSEKVISGVNYLFSQLMSPALGQMEYSQEEYLIPGGDGAKAPGSFALRIIAGGNIQNEAAFVAKCIVEHVQNGSPVLDNGVLRPCQFEDFCILMRARKHMPVFVKALQDENIPTFADLAESPLNTPEVLCLASALAAIDNPADDVNLSATLLGPLFRFSPDELALLRLKNPRGRLWAALAESCDEKNQNFVNQLRYYKTLASAVPLGKLCQALCVETGYLSAVAAMQGGKARRENLLRFMGWAASVSAGLKGGISSFVRLLQSGKGPSAASAKTLKGHVSILTIHKSKGLEFPFVFLSDAAHQFQLSGFGQRVQMHTELGLGLILKNNGSLYPSLQAQAIRICAQNEELSEEMRLLYVALTRAKQHVMVTFASKNPQALLAKTAILASGGMPTAFVLQSQRSMANWLLCALVCQQSGNKLLRQMGIATPPLLPGQAQFQLEVIDPPNAPQQSQSTFALSALPDEKLAAALVQQFKQSPALRPLAEVPAKLSVSALAKSAAPQQRRRPSFMYSGGLSAAERGTAQHSFLQFANFALAAKDPKIERDRLLKEGYISPAQAGAVDIAALKKFFSSPLIGRVNAAQKVLREYDFITSVPAKIIKPDLPKELADSPVLMQGIADLVLVNKNYAEIVDYKTDGGISAEVLANRYRPQLLLYKQALEKRLGLPIKKLSIWSFSLGQELDVKI